MALHQYDFQFYGDALDGEERYYWSQTWYSSDSSVNTTNGPTYAALIAFHGSLQPVGIYRNALRAQRLEPTYHDYGTFTGLNPGTRAVDSPFTALNVARINFLNAGKVVGYKRLRLPLQMSEIDGQELEASFMFTLATALVTLMGDANLCNWHGVPFEAYRIRREVRMWQLRHGTKRRSRVVL